MPLTLSSPPSCLSSTMNERFSTSSPLGRSVFWLCLLAYGLHVIEEYDLGWQPWAVEVLGLPVTWGDFFITNGFGVVPLGLLAGSLAWSVPAASLLLPGVMLVNMVGFHILPTISTGLYSPGLISALMLFLPLGGWCVITAFRHHRRALLLAMPVSVLLMAFPVVMLKLKPLLAFG
ncbi:MAG: HXXEE domain-containing protein [Synechococcaceae bacterium WB9_4xC_028]|nr:HXXEE domain-containing protein [Synechococcaceae bacterium WB9_4xC_028]